ncbi:hypothetical protein MINT15_36970 [Saccharomonospora viridis]|uniref:Uncharacterized protein n=1 Tax=Saccharomonospora viridis TaxID=1852 RepID=A0A837D8G3_9PSEU|nr:hypothetical protein MINT15_36970 [Saccharomonospora viridis]
MALPGTRCQGQCLSGDRALRRGFPDTGNVEVTDGGSVGLHGYGMDRRR